MAYALAADLASYMQATLDTGKATLVLQLVADAMDATMGLDPEDWGSGTVTVGGDTYTGAVLARTVTDLVLDGPEQGSNLLVLPGHPVTSVTDVQVQDVLGTWTELVYQQDYVWNAAGVLTRLRTRLGSAPSPGFYPGPPLQQISILPLTPIWPAIPQGVKVSYGRGYATVPSGLKTVNLTAGARVYANPTGVIGESIGGYSVRYSPRADGGIGGIAFDTLETAVLMRHAEKIVR
jgi:hypothetical protein